jgi:hypothetical protein
MSSPSTHASRMALSLATMALAVLGCRTAPDGRPQASAPPLETSVNSSAPLVLSLDGPKVVEAGQEVDLVIHVERRGEWTRPVLLHAALPAGVTRLEGVTDSTIAPEAPRATAQHLRILVQRVPATDLVVTATAGGEGWGVRAEKHYRFGRPEPRLEDTGSELQPLPPQR